MQLIDKTDLTGLKDDGVPCLSLNPLQQAEKEIFLNRLARGEYQEVTLDTCCLCGSDNAYIIAQKERHGLPLTTVVCEKCGLVRSYNTLDTESAKKFYSSQYRILYSGQTSSNQSTLAVVENAFKTRTCKNDILAFYPSLKLNSGTLVCEIGAWVGANLYSFHRHGIPVIGCDFDREYLRYGRDKGINLIEGSTSELKSLGIKADLVIMIHVLEHIIDPVAFMIECRDIVKSGCFVYTVVPGFKAFRYGAENASSAEGNLCHLLQNAHVYQFELFTLIQVMAKAGFLLIKGDEGCTALFQKVSLPEALETDFNRGKNVLRYVRSLKHSQLFWKVVNQMVGGDYYGWRCKLIRYGLYSLRHPSSGMNKLRRFLNRIGFKRLFERFRS